MIGRITEIMGVSLGEVGIAIIIVFGALSLFMLIIKIRSFMINRLDKNRNINKDINEREAILIEDGKESEIIDLNKEYELVAVIMAALAVHTGKTADQLKIKRIKRVSSNLNWREASMKQ